MLFLELLVLDFDQSFGSDPRLYFHVNIKICQMLLQRDGTLNIIFHVCLDSFNYILSLHFLIIICINRGHGPFRPDDRPVNHVKSALSRLQLKVKAKDGQVAVTRLSLALPLIEDLKASQYTIHSEESVEDDFDI